MKITCQTCAAKYTIADDKVRGKTVKIKCKKCGAAIVAGPEVADDGGASGAGGGEWMVNVGEGDQRTLSIAQVAELYGQGVVSDETYVWRDGMADWQPIGQVAEVKSAVGAAAPAPAPQASVPDEMDDSLPTTMAALPSALMAAASSPRPAAGAPAARRSDPRPNVDLFQPKAPAHEEDEDVATRVASTAELGTAALFGGAPAPAAGAPAARRAPAPAAPSPVRPMAEPAMGPAGGVNNEASGLIDIRNLQSALKKPEAPKNDDKLDDIMNMGGGSPLFSPGLPPPMLAPPSLDGAPPPPEPMPVAAAPTPGVGPGPVADKPKSKTGLLIGGLIGALALVGLGVGGAVMMMGKKGPEQLAENTAKTAQADTSKKEQGSGDAKPAEAEKKAEADKKPESDKPAAGGDADKKPEAAADTAGDPKEKEKEYAALTPEEKKRREEAFKKRKEDDQKKKDEEEKKKKAEEDKKKEAEAAAAAAAKGGGDTGGGGDKPFDRAAAISALNSAAGAAGGCKKSDGPTGSGRVSVTFAPSGAVTTANIEGPPFAGTAVGGCVAQKFRSARVPAFSGSAVTVKKSFSIN